MNDTTGLKATQDKIELYLQRLETDLAEAGVRAEDREIVVAEIRDLVQAGVALEDLGLPSTFASDIAKELNPSEYENSDEWTLVDPRLIVRKRLGYGKDINWIGVALKLGLVNYDDVDQEVLDAIPPAVTAALRWTPLALAGTTAALSFVTYRRRLSMPVRMSLRGKVKKMWSPKASALTMTALSSLLGVGSSVFTKERSKLLNRNWDAIGLNLAILTNLSLSFAQKNGRVHPAFFVLALAALFAVQTLSPILAMRMGANRLAEASEGPGDV